MAVERMSLIMSRQEQLKWISRIKVVDTNRLMFLKDLQRLYGIIQRGVIL